MGWSLIVDEKTAVLTLTHPPANVLGGSVLGELSDRVRDIETDPAVKAVVIGSGLAKFFAAGADIKELAGIDSAEAGRRFSQAGQRVFDAIERSAKPCIAAIEGYCLGGGCELALACHPRIAGREARMGQPEIGLGLIPGFGGTRRLSRLIGPARTTELLLTGKTLSADEAAAIGLVNQTVKSGAALETALDLAKQIQSKSAPAVAAVLKILRDPSAEREAEAFGNLFSTHDTREGIRAFLEKRNPEFKDR